MSDEVVVLFGGTGFIGRVVTHLLCRAEKRVRLVSRQPHLHSELKLYGSPGQVEILQGNLAYPESIDRAIEHAEAVINLAGLLYEKGHQTFKAVHVEGARQLALKSAQKNINRFVHISALGADPNAKARYASTKGAAELAVRECCADAVILRPSLVYGPEDDFFNRFSKLADLMPVLPLIGGGKTRFQPVYVEDLARAIIAVLDNEKSKGKLYEIAGEQTYSFKALMELMLTVKQQKRYLLPVPWPMASFMGVVGDILNSMPFIKPFLTSDQVELLKSDNILSETHAKTQKTQNKNQALPSNGTLKTLKIKAEEIETKLPVYLKTVGN